MTQSAEKNERDSATQAETSGTGEISEDGKTPDAAESGENVIDPNIIAGEIAGKIKEKTVVTKGQDQNDGKTRRPPVPDDLGVLFDNFEQPPMPTVEEETAPPTLSNVEEPAPRTLRSGVPPDDSSGKE